MLSLLSQQTVWAAGDSWGAAVSSDHGLTGRERSETGNGGSVRSHSSHSRQCGPLETPGVLR